MLDLIRMAVKMPRLINKKVENFKMEVDKIVAEEQELQAREERQKAQWNSYFYANGDFR